ncbi:MAG: DNA polymerase III subunit alpha [Alphaproteobacteria bacterium]|nr:DNA polymerase III subunit alpha [Alphaproteobacteria bacterium]
MFIHLHLHSSYSLTEGAIKPKALVKHCKSENIPAVAVTDTNDLFGAMEFALEAASNGIQPIIGTQIELAGKAGQLVLLAQTAQGYRNLCAIVSEIYLNRKNGEDLSVPLQYVLDKAEGIIALTGGKEGLLAKALLEGKRELAQSQVEQLFTAFGDRLYIELQRHGLPHEKVIESDLIDFAYKYNIPLVATNEPYFLEPDMFEAHDALLCIADKTFVHEANRRRVTPEHYFKSDVEMQSLFKDLPEAIENTVEIAKRCSFLLQEIKPLLPKFSDDENKEIVDRATEGLKWRLENYVKDKPHEPYYDRLKFELDTIVKMGFAGYFLIVSDFIGWAKDHDIPVGPGRGSGAASVIAWALKITDLDPLHFNLLFERFLNPERVSMPDFDIDFCQERRDEVIRYVQQRYGDDRVAQIITFGKLQARAVVRDVGRVLNMPLGQVDRIAKMIPNNPANPITLEEAIAGDPEMQALRESDQILNKLFTIALQLEGLNRNASTHAAGVVIGDRPLVELLPVYRDEEGNMPATQFNMKYIEQAGLIKFDFLGLKTLTVIQKAIEMIAHKTGEKLDILKIPLDDEITYKLLSAGNTAGVFQVESAGMRDVLVKMRPDRFEDIIALVALYRPGPMDNIPQFIDVKNGKQEADYLHPKLRPMLEETYGIMVYQEQVMQAAQILSGYTLGGADLLRRAMGKKIQSEMDAQRAQFIKGAAEHSQVDAGQASAIFDQVDKFAGYGFNKAHAAAYALISYQTAWLKANYPVEFMAASMTLDMGNTDKLAGFKQELDRMGIALLPPDINKSIVTFAVEDGAIRYALGAIKGVGADAMQMLINERSAKGGFKSLEDLMKRVDSKCMNKRILESLISAGAFDNMVPNRAKIYNAVEAILAFTARAADERSTGQTSLFGGSAAVEEEKIPLPDMKDWALLEKLGYEFDAIGFYLSSHPLEAQAGLLRANGITFVNDVAEKMQASPKQLFKMAAVILKKQEKVSSKSGNRFGILTLSDPTGVFEGMLYSENLMRFRSVIEEGKPFSLKVLAELNGEQVRFLVQDIQKFEDVLNRNIRDITLTLSRTEQIKTLKENLDAAEKGSVGVLVHIDDRKHGTCEFRLPGRWNLTAQKAELWQRDGVADKIGFV